jgi:undecaprenyl-diphosphatase
MFINRLLPVGLGAIGANFAYLRTQKHSRAQAAVVVAANNIVGFIGHAVVLTAAFVLLGVRLPDGIAGNQLRHGWLLAAGVLIIGVSFVLLWRTQRRVRKTLQQLIGHYRRRPVRVLAAVLTSALLTISNVWCLQFCLQATGINLPFTTTLLIFTFGVGLGTAVPTPGGLGGVEAGLVAGLVAYDVAGAPALAAVVLYRLISYWFALATGALAFVYCRQRSLFRLG